MRISDVVLIGGALLMAAAAFAALTRPYDDSDPPGGRSGLTPKTDHLTGCQYLESPKGGLTPRLDAQGQHVCRQRN